MSKWIFLSFAIFLAFTQNVFGSWGEGNHDERCFSLSHSFTPTVKYKFVTKADIRGRPLILPSGDVVITSIDGNIYFLSPQAKLKTSFHTSGGIVGGAVYGKNQLIVVGSGDGKIYFLTLSGEVRRILQTGGSILSTPAVAPDGTIVVGSTDGVLHFLNPNGSVRAEYKLPVSIHGNVAAAADGTLVLGASNGIVYFFTSDGALKSLYNAGSAVGNVAISSSGNIVFGTSDGEVHILDLNGVQISVDQGTPAFFGTPMFLPDNSFVIGSFDRRLSFFGAQNNFLRSINLGATFPGNPALFDDQHIVTGSNDNVLHFLSLDGQEVASLGPLGDVEFGQSALSTPTVMNDGTVVVGSAVDLTAYFIGTDLAPRAISCPSGTF